MFFDNMFDAFEIELKELISDLDHAHILVCEKELDITNEPAISTVSNENFGSLMHDICVDFAHIDSIRGSYVFTKKEMEMQILTKDSRNILDDNPAEFAATISNPIGIHSKGRKPKNTAQNSFKKVKVGSVNQIDYGDTLNTYRSELRDIIAITKNLSRHCGICGQVGHNARTYNLDSSSNRIINMNQKCYSDQNYDLPLSITKHSENSNLVDVYVACGQTGYNARTCNSDNANKQMNDLVLEYNHKNYVENSNSISIADKDSINNKLRHCGACGQTCHNTRTCDFNL
ncbi:13638_t:CDS:2 [Gigaspora rosea]|nr:13638_t:CDS:2 [Gigaspora rosea]